jgi:hypothetical protein
MTGAALDHGIERSQDVLGKLHSPAVWTRDPVRQVFGRMATAMERPPVRLSGMRVQFQQGASRNNWAAGSPGSGGSLYRLATPSLF